MRSLLRRLFRLFYIGIIISTLFFFSLFFSLFILGYQLTISEPNILIASTELFLTGSTLIYFIRKNIQFDVSQSIAFKYPLLSLAVMQPLDAISTWLDYWFGHGHEANIIITYLGGIFNPTTIYLKIVIFPLLLIFAHYIKWRQANSKTRLAIRILLVAYIIVVLNNLSGIFI